MTKIGQKLVDQWLSGSSALGTTSFTNNAWNISFPLLSSDSGITKFYATVNTSNRDFYITYMTWSSNTTTLSFIIAEKSSIMVTPSNLGSHSFRVSILVIDAEQ